MKPPAFQFYADDFVGGTCDLSAADVGAYIRLLCYQWSRGAIPTEPEKLERVAGGKVSADVLAKFPGGKNARMEQEREKQVAFREEQSRKGQAGAQARWKNGSGHAPANAPAMAQAMPRPSPGQWPNDGSPSPSPSPISKEERGDARAREESAEVPDLKQAEAMVMADGIPSDFIALAHADWTDNGGKNAKGIDKPWVPYVRGRWRYEAVEWRNGTHRGRKRNGGPNAAHGGPSWKEVASYAAEKDDASKSATVYAASWFRAWEARGWKSKDGRTIDWKVKFSADLAGRGVR